jgi:hypothetical protein
MHNYGYVSSDLRWMRIRRAPGIASRVPISYDRDKQLREIFTNLDFGKTGVVLLSDLKAASDFVELRMEASRKRIKKPVRGFRSNGY